MWNTLFSVLLNTFMKYSIMDSRSENCITCQQLVRPWQEKSKHVVSCRTANKLVRLNLDKPLRWITDNNYVGELTDIMWASHLLCGRVCCGRVCLWTNSPFSDGNPKTLIPGPRIPTTDRVHRQPTDQSTDYPYGPLYRPPPKLNEKHHNKDFTYSLSNRSLVSAKFRTLRWKKM